MNKASAIRLVGTRVQAWTSANGVYSGTLVAVIPSRPWRAQVLIDGVIEPACPWEMGKVRRGKRPGETIEVGGVNISPTILPGRTYLECLEAQKVAFEAMNVAQFWAQESIRAITRLIAEEKSAVVRSTDTPASVGSGVAFHDISGGLFRDSPGGAITRNTSGS